MLDQGVVGRCSIISECLIRGLCWNMLNHSVSICFIMDSYLDCSIDADLHQVICAKSAICVFNYLPTDRLPNPKNGKVVEVTFMTTKSFWVNRTTFVSQ